MLMLLCHKETPAASVKSIEVTVQLNKNGRLWLRYHVDCDLKKLETGHPEQPERRDGLWQTTCFEAFIRMGESDEYIELNFAPSSQWAAYQFASYRAGMVELEVDPPEIGLDASETHFALEADMMLPYEFRGAALNMAISAVIEETDGTKSYWALRHPDQDSVQDLSCDPDFHDRACFTLQLLPAEAP
jgi:hypothetical protein